MDNSTAVDASLKAVEDSFADTFGLGANPRADGRAEATRRQAIDEKIFVILDLIYAAFC